MIKSNKNTAIRVRVQAVIKKQFKAACKAKGVKMSKLIDDFIKEQIQIAAQASK